MVSEYGPGPKTTICSFKNFTRIFQVSDKHRTGVVASIREHRNSFSLCLGFQNVGPIVAIREVPEQIAVTEQNEPAIDYLFAFVFPAAVNAKQRWANGVGCLLVPGH